MAIELSNLTFTEQDDTVPPSGMEPISNTGIANTLAGNDTITGIRTSLDPVEFSISGFYNTGTLNTSDGNDIITGISHADYNNGISNLGTINTDDGDDTITGGGISSLTNYSTITTGNGNDLITGNSEEAAGIYSRGYINSGEGEDTLTGNSKVYGIFNGLGNQLDSSTIDTGGGGDIITGIAAFGIFNTGIINTGNGADSIISDSSSNSGTGYGFFNGGIINTGNGNDLITEVSSRSIFNYGIIDTGNGDDSLIANGGFYEDSYQIPGSVFLGNGKDYLKGFGSGEFSGGNDEDKLELTSGTYTVGKWYTAVTFTKGDQLMITSEFEKLIVGSTTYDFSSLTKGQTITVA